MVYISQIDGLGFSNISKRYAIRDLKEEAAYLMHPVLGRRLIDISNALLDIPGYDATAVMGSPDDLKLIEYDLFALVSGANQVFEVVLHKYFHGQ